MKKKLMALCLILTVILSMALPVYAVTSVPLEQIIMDFPKFVIIKDPNFAGSDWYRIIAADSTGVFTKVDSYYAGVNYWEIHATGAKTITSSTSAPVNSVFNNQYLFGTYSAAGAGTWASIATANGNGIIVGGNVIVKTSTGETAYDPNPTTTHTVNVGDYIRITKPSGKNSTSTVVNVVAGNEPYYRVKNYTSAGTMEEFEATPLFDSTHVSTDHIDLQLKSTRNNEPITITTDGQFELLATGGELPASGIVQEHIELTTNPDTLILTNLTGEAQSITYGRTETGEGQYTTLLVEKKVDGYWKAMGATPKITDNKSRTINLQTNTRYTIYNCNGSTKVQYPVISGLTAETRTQGTGQIPNAGGGMVVPDDPTIITDPSQWGGVPGSTTVPTAPDNILGILQWAGNLLAGFLSIVTTALAGITTFLGKFTGIFSAISFLPPEFSMPFSMLVITSLALRVVGK